MELLYTASQVYPYLQEIIPTWPFLAYHSSFLIAPAQEARMFKRSSPSCCRLFFSFCASLVLVASSQSAMTQESKSVLLEVDHVSVCGSNLDSLRQDFSSVGLTPDLGGPHGNGVTQMAMIGFDDASYIELIAPIKPGVTEGSAWAKYMSAGP